ncbi:MAG TPA: hypothetical protein ENN40_11595 [Candidatus Aminicenantes bacterium]|nr:hypothetical protein [Candidatus Aminicenantes bacterium]
MKKLAIVLLVFMVVLLAAGCAAGPNSLEKTADREGKVSGFWKGLWHGFISPVTFLVSLFTDKVHLYEVHNNGNWYNFGFVLGAGLFLSGGILGRRKNGKH